MFMFLLLSLLDEILLLKSMLEDKDKKMKDMSTSIGALASKHSEALKHLTDENKALRTQVSSMKKESAALKKQCESLSKQQIKQQHSASEEEEVQDEEEEAPPPLSRQTNKKNASKPAPGRPRKKPSPVEEEEEESDSDGRSGARVKKEYDQLEQKRSSLDYLCYYLYYLCM
jgi:cobalamin biosynthesis Mg chelatase CobN